MYNAREMSDEMKKCRIQMSKRSDAQRGIVDKSSYIANVTNENNILELQYQDENAMKFVVKYDNQSVKMKCIGETTSSLDLVLHTWTNVEITTPFGNMLLKSRALKIEHSKNHLLVCYELNDGNERVDIIQIQWDIYWDSIS